MFNKVLARSPGKRAAEALHASAARQARTPSLYLNMGAPDTVQGRFELLTLHVILLIDRLEGESGAAAQLRQALFDTYVSNLEGAIREMGVGDLAVGKRMRKLGEAFYGRAQSYSEAFRSLPDRALVADVLGRTVLAGEPASATPGLADYVVRSRLSLASCAIDEILGGNPSWVAP